MHLHDEIRPWLPAQVGQSLWCSRGCPACHGTGYGGRTGLFEVLRVSTALRRLIAEGQPTQVLRDQAVRDGLIELRQSALVKVALGQTTRDEAARGVPSEFFVRTCEPRQAAPARLLPLVQSPAAASPPSPTSSTPSRVMT